MFTETLLNWFADSQRDLPWRGENDPYRIWVSEIILQQTRVAQGIRYYHDFLLHFPDVSSLASANEADVLKVWQGLGYYSRARNMQYAAQTIMRDHNGIFPCSYDEIRKLKGIGDYTAAAIASIAFSLPHPAVDGNVLRFVTRYAGIFENIALPATRRNIEQWCGRHISHQHPGTFNQAMMEMGALICLPSNPNCDNCPFQTECHAHIHGQTQTLPIKEVKIRIRERFFNYLIYVCNNQTIIQKRTGNDIWKGLYEFPLIETNDGNFSPILDTSAPSFQSFHLILEKKHVLTHQRIFAKFFLIPIQQLPSATGNQIVVEIPQLQQYAVSKITADAVALLSSPHLL